MIEKLQGDKKQAPVKQAPVLTPLQKAQAEKAKAQGEAVAKIKKLLEENELDVVAQHIIQIVPKK